MKRKCTISLIILLLWFTMDMTGFSIGNIILVEPAWNSIDGIWWLIFISLVLMFIWKDKIFKYVLSAFIFIWLFIQYSSHWHYTIFGATPKKIISYNNYFEKTFRTIPSSSTVIIPDFYHIVLHIFLLNAMILLIIFCIRGRNEVRKDNLL